MTGFQPSGIRAGIFGALFLLAQKVGRKAESLRIIIIAGSIIQRKIGEKPVDIRNRLYILQRLKKN